MMESEIAVNERFTTACEAAAARERGGIGTLGERTLHAALKYYFEPDPSCHEIKVGGYHADILNESGITEIQTRQLSKLRGKLAAFLPECPVTVVYPVTRCKWLVWIDPETGEATKRRRSPKIGTVYDAFRELYGIKQFLAHPDLSVRIQFVDLDEYRLLNGWSRDRKKGSWRNDRIPVAFGDEIELAIRADYVGLVPQTLADGFTVKDFAKATRQNARNAGVILNILNSMGAVERTGKQGNAFTYTKVR